MRRQPALQSHLRQLEADLRLAAPDLAVFLVFDRPERVDDRPGLERAMFRERCLSDERLEAIITALRDVGVWVQLLRGEDEFLSAAAAGEMDSSGRRTVLIYNGIEGGIAHDGFAPGRKALIPAVADSYGWTCANSNPYACAIGRHKYHYFTILKAHGLPVPDVWHFRPGFGWAGGRVPGRGTRVIAKSTYESWSVGVSDDSVFQVDHDVESRIAAIADEIGQAVCVQEFVPGREVGVSVFGSTTPRSTTPVEVILHKAIGDPDAVVTMQDNLAAAAVSYEPFDGDELLMNSLDELAVACFQTLELSSFARMDFRIDLDRSPWLSDVGVSPGLGPAGSSSFESVRALGFSHADFIRIVFGASLAAAVVSS